jgi:transcriptional regulator with XRE-family HTH domain
MNRKELQQLKMAWLAAEDAGDRQAQFALLQDHPEAQEALIDFIAACRASQAVGPDARHTVLLPLTQRAAQTALERVFGPAIEQGATATPITATNLRELRSQRGLSMVQAARGLRLGIDVWKKFEDGTIELLSLEERPLARLAHFFQVSVEQFCSMLTNSSPALTLNRRQTASAAQKEQQGAKKQSFAEAIERSTMSEEDKSVWLGEI